MKYIIYSILSLGICLIGFFNVKSLSAAKVTAASQVNATAASEHLRVLSSVSTLKLGETGAITIKGKPRTVYSISTTYSKGGLTIPVVQWRTTDRTGVTTFNWIVGHDTVPGTYDATIAGGGESLRTKHTVLP